MQHYPEFHGAEAYISTGHSRRAHLQLGHHRGRTPPPWAGPGQGTPPKAGPSQANGADKTKPDSVKDPEQLNAETVNNADGTDGTEEKTGNVKGDNKQNTEGADKTSTDGHNR